MATTYCEIKIGKYQGYYQKKEKVKRNITGLGHKIIKEIETDDYIEIKFKSTNSEKFKKFITENRENFNSYGFQHKF